MLGKPIPGPISTRAEAVQPSVISRPGSCGAFVLFLGRRLLCWFSGQRALIKMHLVRADGCGGNGIILLSHPRRGEFTPTTAQEVLTEEPTVSPLGSQASVRTMPSPSLSEPSACSVGVQYSCVLSQVHRWVSKHQKDWEWCRSPLILSGRVSLHSGWCQLAPEKQSHSCARAWIFMVKQEAGIQVNCPQQVPLLLC